MRANKARERSEGSTVEIVGQHLLKASEAPTVDGQVLVRQDLLKAAAKYMMAVGAEVRLGE